MRYTEEQLTSACMAFSDRLWHVGWSEASEAHRMGVRKAMLEALSTLPDPQPGPMPTMGIDYREQHKQERGRWENLRDAQIRQIKALEKKSKRLEDELGRANCERDEARAEVERWRQRHADVEEQLRSAVAQGVADSESHAAVPFQVTADEAIAATKTMATQYPERNAKVRWEDVADSVNEQLQKRQPIPVPSDAVRDALVWLWCAYPQITERPARWQVRNAMLALGDGPHEDEQDSAASGEAERIAELEAKLAAVTEERDRLSVSARNSYHDGYRDSQSQRHAADERARVAADERDEALLKSERAQVSCTAAIDDARKACAARDEALAKLANVEAEADHHAQERESLRSQLAARPEPVVIDEALAERVFDAYYRAHGLSGGPAMLVGLRSVFGAHASVSVPQGEESTLHHNWVKREDHERLQELYTAERGKYDQHLANNHATVDNLQKELAWYRKALTEYSDGQQKQYDRADAAESERDQLRAELADRADPVYVAQLQGEVTRLRELMARADPCEEYTAQLRRIADAVGSDVAIDEVDVVAISKLAELRAELAKTRAELESCKRFHTHEHKDRRDAEAELEKLRADLAACRVERDTWLGEHGRVTAEFEACKGDAEAVRQLASRETERADNHLTAWREVNVQHEALRAQSERALIAFDSCGTGAWAQFNALRTLLKPATPEAIDLDSLVERREIVESLLPEPQPPTWLKPVLEDAQSRHVDVSEHAQRQIDGIRAGAAQLDEAVGRLAAREYNDALSQAVRIAKREVHVPEHDMAEAERLGRGAPRFKPIYAKLDETAVRVDEHDRILRTFLSAWARGSFNKDAAGNLLGEMRAVDARSKT